MVKRLKQNNVAKSEIISVTGHSTAAGLDPYDSGDEKLQQIISNATGNCSIKAFSHRQYFILPNDPGILNPTFFDFSAGRFSTKYTSATCPN